MITLAEGREILEPAIAHRRSVLEAIGNPDRIGEVTAQLDVIELGMDTGLEPATVETWVCLVVTLELYLIHKWEQDEWRGEGQIPATFVRLHWLARERAGGDANHRVLGLDP